jgi:flagellar motor switch protein FliG
MAANFREAAAAQQPGRHTPCAVAEIADGTRRVPAALSPFRFLHGLGIETVLAALADERPQTIALVVSHLPAPQAAEIIDSLASERQAAVLGQVAAMDLPDPEVVCDVAAGVQRRLAAAEGRKSRHGLASVVKMLNAMPPVPERELLGSIAQSDPELLREIRRAMFGADVAACCDWDLLAAAG